MRFLLRYIGVICAILMMVHGQVKGQETIGAEASFSFFSYRSTDSLPVYQPNRQFLNPILAGCYPDPSICRKGNDYYLVNSSFSYYPGIPIWHSTDLVHWKQIGHVLNRHSQLNLQKNRLNGGIYAPDIKYNPYNDTFYLVTTNCSGGGNFYVTCKDPQQGNWSDPVYLPEVTGIDPAIFFDEDGRTYVVHNTEPEGQPLYDGHRAIRIHELDLTTGKTIGKSKVIINGGVDISTRPVWIEGPHLYKINGVYYLMAAEGGTAINHREVVFKATNPMGPYTPCAVNPILTQMDLPADRPDAVTCTGHADLVQTPAGDWWAVFLGVRPGTTCGRETFMLPVTWQEGQPIILPAGKPVPLVVPYPGLKKGDRPTVGSRAYFDFEQGVLPDDFQFLRTPQTQWWKCREGKLYLQARQVALSDVDNPSFVGYRIKDQDFEVQTEVDFCTSEPGIAGLTGFQDEKNYYIFGKCRDRDGKISVRILQSEKGQKSITIAPLSRQENEKPLRLKMESKQGAFHFFYSLDGGKHFVEVGAGTKFPVAVLNPVEFTGSFVGLYCAAVFDDVNDYDWANYGRYGQENQAVKKPVKAVFMGNSITEFWVKTDPGFFQRNGYVGRGISGQTTSQMLARFRQDVIALQPGTVVILAGTNDLARNQGYISVEHIADNIISMCELARLHRIRVILCSVLPAYDYGWRKGLQPADQIIRLNQLLKAYAEENGLAYVDFHTAMKDERNGLPKHLAEDGVHPTLEGYRMMEEMLQKEMIK